MKKYLFIFMCALTVAMLAFSCKIKTVKDELVITEIAGVVRLSDSFDETVTIRVLDTVTRVARTFTFNPNGETLYRYRLTKDGKSGSYLSNYLNDVDFDTLVPSWNPPEKYITVRDTILQENGSWTIGEFQRLNPEWDPDYAIKFIEKQGRLHIWMINNLELQQYMWYPKIPAGGSLVWQSVDMTKPYSERFTRIPAEPGKYNGPKWQPSLDIYLYERFAYYASRKSPAQAIKWISSGYLDYR